MSLISRRLATSSAASAAGYMVHRTAANTHSFSSLHSPPFSPVVPSSGPSSRAQGEELLEECLKSMKLLIARTAKPRTTQQEFEYKIKHSTTPSIAYESYWYFYHVSQHEPGFEFSVSLFTHFLDDLTRHQRYNYVFQLFRHAMSAVTWDLETYNTLLHCICKANVHDPLVVLGRVLVSGYIPDQVTYVNLIESLIRGNRVDAAKFFMTMKKYDCFSYLTDHHTITNCECLIGRLTLRGHTSYGVWILEEMISINDKPNNLTYKWIIEGLCEEGNIDGAIQVFFKIKCRGFLPHYSAYLSLITPLFLVGRYGEGMSLLNEMMDPRIRSLDVEVDIDDLTRILRHRGKKEEAWKQNTLSAMCVSEHTKDTFSELYVIFRVDEKKKEVVVEKTGSPAESYGDFIAALPENDCRYAVYDSDFVTSDNCQKSKIFFFAWSPATSRIRSKMLYATSKDNFRRELDRILYEIQATEPTEMDLDVIRD